MATDGRDHDEAFGRRATRGAVAMLAARFTGTAVAILATAVLARFVSPEEFGLVAMVLSAIALARAFEEVGLGDATVQRAEVTEAQLSALFWLNLAVGALLAGAFAAASPLLAAFFGQPEVMPIALALAPLFLLSAGGAQHRAVMRRRFRFRPLAVSQTASVCVGAAAGCTCAALEWGVWSLVVQNLAAALALLVGSWLGAGWRPGPPRSASGMRPLLSFGAQLTASRFLTAVTRNIDGILLGRVAGAEALGTYDRAFQLMSLPASQFNQPLSSAMVPALSRLQHDPEAFRRLYRSATEAIAFIAFPIAVFSAAAAPALVLTLLGPRWVESATLLRALAPAGLMLSLNAGTAWVYQSLGRTDRQLRWTAIGSTVAVCGIVAGLPWGALGVAIGLSGARVLLRPFGVAYCFRGTFLRPSDLLSGAWRPALAALVGGAVAYLLDPAELAPALRLATQLGLFLVAAFAAMLCIPGGLRRLSESRRIVAAFRRPVEVAP